MPPLPNLHVSPPPEKPPEVVARVYGEAMTSVPMDLYIPPEALQVFLEMFEGPLDLLLYLIRKQNINVLDIPMADLTKQYLGYVEMMRRHNLELAAEYLLMAAVLLEIKSRLLLPKPPSAAGESTEDPRAELVRRLLEYEQMKAAAQTLDALPQEGRDYDVVRVWFDRTVAVTFPDVDPEDLRRAWAALIARAKADQHHLITREQLSVREEMSRVLRLLEEGDFWIFTRLFNETADLPHLVVTFLAILELAREQMIEIAQTEPSAPIYVRAKSEKPFLLDSEAESLLE
ncbi:MAG: segregation/condensation protein A [Burkholderiales bacterium]|nr:segregation/condensation protein A [Burkholderiales bacterium]